MKDDNNVIRVKDEGDFFTTKVTSEGKLPERGKMYPFGELITKVFYSRLEAKIFAANIGFKIEFN